MWEHWLRRARLWKTVDDWVQHGAIGRRGVRRIARWYPPSPSQGAWERFLSDACLVLGSVLVAAGIVLWVAANWSGFSRLARIGLLEVLLVAVASPAVLPRLSNRAASACLFVACVILGALWALIGQQYQTGADSWQMFAVWAVTMLPWAVAARAVSVWLLWIGIVNVALVLFVAQRSIHDWVTSMAMLAGGNLGLLLLFEWGLPKFALPRVPLLIRILAGWLVFALSVWASVVVVRHFALAMPVVGVLALWAGVCTALGLVYSFLRPDLAILAMLGLSLVWVIATTSVAAYWDRVQQGPLVVLAILVVFVPTFSALMAGGLRRLGRTRRFRCPMQEPVHDGVDEFQAGRPHAS